MAAAIATMQTAGNQDRRVHPEVPRRPSLRRTEDQHHDRGSP
jgi:hypothetical protein